MTGQLQAGPKSTVSSFLAACGCSCRRREKEKEANKRELVAGQSSLRWDKPSGGEVSRFTKCHSAGSRLKRGVRLWAGNARQRFPQRRIRTAKMAKMAVPRPLSQHSPNHLPLGDQQRAVRGVADLRGWV